MDDKISFCEFPVNLVDPLRGFRSVVIGCGLALFFLSSGFLFSFKDSWAVFLGKKVKRLLIPYVSFAVISIVLRNIFAAYLHGTAPGLGHAVVMIATGGCYWFLYALFWIMVLCKLIHRSIGLILVALLSIVLYCLNLPMPEIVRNGCLFAPFFIAGIFLRQHYELLLRFMTGRYLSIYLSIYLLAIYFSNLCPQVLEIVKGVSGCAFMWTISLLEAKLNDRVLRYLGHYSLQFYLNHMLITLPCYYMAAMLPYHIPFLQWLLIFIAALTIAYVMLLVERRFKWSRWMCGMSEQDAPGYTKS